MAIYTKKGKAGDKSVETEVGVEKTYEGRVYTVNTHVKAPKDNPEGNFYPEGQETDYEESNAESKEEAIRLAKRQHKRMMSKHRRSTEVKPHVKNQEKQKKL